MLIKKRKPKVTGKVKFSKKMPDGTTLQGEMDPDTVDLQDEEETGEDSEELFEPQSDLDRVSAALSGNASPAVEFQLHRIVPESGETVFVEKISVEKASNPELIKQAHGGGKYLIRSFENGSLVQTFAVNIDGQQKAPVHSPVTIQTGNDNTSNLFAMMISQQQAATEAMRAQMEVQKEEVRAGAARSDKLLEVLLPALISRKEETKLDELVKVAQIMKGSDSSSEALGSVLEFMSTMGKTMSTMLTGNSDSPWMFALQQFKPVIETFMQKFAATRGPLPGLIPAATGPVGATVVSPSVNTANPNPQNGPATQAGPLLAQFETGILPELIRAAKQRYPDGSYMREPWAFAETLEFQFEPFGADLKTLLLDAFGTKDHEAGKQQLFLRFVVLQQTDIAPWFSDLWDGLMLGPLGRKQVEEAEDMETPEDFIPTTAQVVK